MVTDQQQDVAPLPADASVTSRDFRVQGISIIPADGNSIDISLLVVELQVRQDLYLGFMNGELLINDGVDLHSKLALHGDEYLYLNISEPNQDVSIKKAFRIYKVGNRVPMLNNTQQYIIYFVSDELVQSNTKKVSKAYKATKISDIASDIMINWLNIPATGIVAIDETSEAVDVIIPNYRPSEALNWLATRSYNTDQSCYFFYENLDGFNFRSIQKMYADGVVNKTPIVFQRKSLDRQMSEDKRSIDNFKSMRDFDVLTAVSNGGYAAKLLGLDLFNQSINVNEYDLNSVSKLYENLAIHDLKDVTGELLFDRSDAHLMTYIQTEKDHSELWIKRVLSLAALNNNLLELTIPGSMELQIGKVVDILFPYTITPTVEADMWDKRKSGKYLVVAVNHQFMMTTGFFNTILMIARDSMPIALPSPDSDLVSKIAKLNNT